MTPQEQYRLKQHQTYIQKGQVFFDRLVAYYEQEPLLVATDIFDRTESTVRLKYLNRHYLLELCYNEENSFGQIRVFESELGTEFWINPKFILKPTSLIFYDSPGNVFISSMVGHRDPENSAEDLIREITK